MTSMMEPPRRALAGKMLVETLAAALGVHVLRQHSNLESASVSLPVARGALDPRRLRGVRDFIETHFGEDLTLETLAKEACLSPFHFAGAFKGGDRDGARCAGFLRRPTSAGSSLSPVAVRPA